MIRPKYKPSEKIRVRSYIQDLNRRAEAISTPGSVVTSGVTGSGMSTSLGGFLRKNSSQPTTH